MPTPFAKPGDAKVPRFNEERLAPCVAGSGRSMTTEVRYCPFFNLTLPEAWLRASVRAFAPSCFSIEYCECQFWRERWTWLVFVNFNLALYHDMATSVTDGPFKFISSFVLKSCLSLDLLFSCSHQFAIKFHDTVVHMPLVFCIRCARTTACLKSRCYSSMELELCWRLYQPSLL